MEEDFPRGSGSRPTPSKGRLKEKVKQAAKTAKKRPIKDVLFKETEAEAPTQTKKKKKKVKEDEETSAEISQEKEFEATAEGEGLSARPLSQKTISEGMQVLATVQEVHDYEIILSLPGGLTAFVQITDVSSLFTKQLQEMGDEDDLDNTDVPNIRDFFHVGDFVPCVVKSVSSSKDGHRRIRASLDYKDINAELGISLVKPGMVMHGCVSSIEDHGYTVDLGIKGLTAFLGKESSKKKKASQLCVAQRLSCVVKEVKAKGRSVILTHNPLMVKKAKATTTSHTTFSTMIPGTKVEAMVTKIFPNCVAVDVLGLYQGCVDVLHLQNIADDLTDLHIGQKLDSVIVYNCPTTKTLGLSFSKSHQKLNYDAETDLIGDLSTGDIVKQATVVKVLGKNGAVLQLTPKTRGIVYQSHLSDDKQRKPNLLKPGDKVTCRILNFNFFDGLAIVSLRKSVLEKPFLGIKDIQPGMLVKGVVENVGPKGVAVKIQDRVHGFVPRIHLGDVPVQKPQDRFNIGSEIELRVLLVDAAKRRVLLTHKKTLVKSTLPLLTSYTQPQQGMWLHGCIVAVKEFGCIMSFYNDIKGIIPRSELGMDRSVSPTENFYIGQVLKCRVFRTHDPDTKKLTLSLLREGQQQKGASIEAGKITKVKVTRIRADGLDVVLLPSNQPAFIPKMHLSDFPDNCGSLLASYSVGDIIDQAMTWSYNVKTKTYIVSCKPLLVAATRSNSGIVKEFDELQTDLLLLGVMRHAMSYGVFVEFPNNIVGLAPKAAMSDDFLTDTSKAYQVGQTLRAKVTEVDLEKKRFLVSLKASDCCHGDDSIGDSLEALEAYFQERDRAEITLREKRDYKHLVSLSVGSVVHGTVRSTQGKGVVCSLPHGIDAIISQQHIGGKAKEGDSIEARVLHIDLSNRVVTLSTKPNLLEGCKKSSKLKSKKANKKKMTADSDSGNVLLVRENFILAHSNAGQFVYFPAKQHLNDFTLDEDRISVGRSVRLGEIRLENGRLLGIQVKESQSKKFNNSKEKDTKSSNSIPGSYPSVGQMVNAVVRSVKGTQVNVEIEGGVLGRIPATEVTDDVKPGSYPLEAFSIGKKVEAKVIGHRYGKRHQHLPISHGHRVVSLLELSLRKSVIESETLPSEVQDVEHELKAFQPGQNITCIVNKCDRDILWVHITRAVEGKVHRLNLSKHPSTLQHPESYFKPGQVHKAKVIRQDKAHGMLELSMSGNASSTLDAGTVVNCRITRVQNNKVSVQLPFGNHGDALLTDISDVYTENALEGLEVDQYHRCCILETAKEGTSTAVSLRPSRVKKTAPPEGSDKEILTVDSLTVGQLVRGYVKHCSTKGVFVSLSRNIHGRILLKKLSAYYVEDPSTLLKVGQLITTKVLSVDADSGRVELSSSSKDTGLEDLLPEHLRQKSGKRKREGKSKKRNKRAADEGSDSGLGEAETLSDTEAEIITVSKKSVSSAPCLQLSAGFSWDESSTKPKVAAPHSSKMSVDDDDDDEEEDDEKGDGGIAAIDEPPSKKSMRTDELAEETLLYKTERALMDSERVPETTDDFDRLVASSPNSSLAWIRYMAFHLHSVDIDKARAVAERSLKTINFREEQEKLNVWVAYLNLENMYGTEDEVVAVLQRALQQCEPIKVFTQLVAIYIRTNKIQQAEQLYESMLKRFKFDCDVWIGYGTFLMKNGRHEQARRLMQRSFKSLVQKDHVGVIVKFAQLEYRYSEAERGKTMFENVLSNYPKRTDIWSIYLDMTIRQEDTEASRHLFERVIHLNLSAKKIKFFFKRYLDFEKKCGDESSVTAVKQKAVEYVESKAAVSQDI